MDFIKYVLSFLVANGILLYIIRRSINHFFDKSLQKNNEIVLKSIAQYENDLINQTYAKSKFVDSKYNSLDEIWTQLIETRNAVFQLYPRGIINVPVDKDELLEFDKKRLISAKNQYIAFRDLVERKKIILDDDLISEIQNILDLCKRQVIIFETHEIDRKISLTFIATRNEPMSRDDNFFVYDEFYQRFDESYNQVQKRLTIMINEFNPK